MMSEKVANRLVSAVERENQKSLLRTKLMAAQMAQATAKRALEDAEYALQVAQNNIDDFDDAPDAD